MTVQERREKGLIVNEEASSQCAGVIYPGLARARWSQFRRWFNSGVIPKLIVLWLLAVFVDGAILFMAMVGMLNLELSPTERPQWVEVTSQIMNALFLSAALATHPGRLRATYLYFTDFGKLQKEDGNGLSRADLGWILGLLNLNCLAQYVVSIFMFAYGPKTRSPFSVAVPLVISFAAGGVGGWYRHRRVQRVKKALVDRQKSEGEEKEKNVEDGARGCSNVTDPDGDVSASASTRRPLLCEDIDVNHSSPAYASEPKIVVDSA